MWTAKRMKCTVFAAMVMALWVNAKCSCKFWIPFQFMFIHVLPMTLNWAKFLATFLAFSSWILYALLTSYVHYKILLWRSHAICCYLASVYCYLSLSTTHLHSLCLHVDVDLLSLQRITNEAQISLRLSNRELINVWLVRCTWKCKRMWAQVPPTRTPHAPLYRYGRYFCIMYLMFNFHSILSKNRHRTHSHFSLSVRQTYPKLYWVSLLCRIF